MAELLIYAKIHWTSESPVSAHVKMRKKYRYWDRKVQSATRRGDIIEVREDGYWSEIHGWNKKVFALLKIPGLSLEEAGRFMDPRIWEVPNVIPDEPPREHILSKHRYAVQVEIFPGKILEFPNLSHIMLLDKAI